MGKRDKRVDAYIAKSADFAKPILASLRETMHEACPDCEETLKWGMPSFTYHGILASMAAFKAHCTFGFWKHTLVTGAERRDERFGRLTAVSQVPSKKQMIAWTKRAMELNESGVKPARAVKRSKPAIPEPAYFKTALAKNKKAKATYAGFSPSHRREYLEWITGAKTEETRERRLAQALEWMAEGKPRNWKYM